MVLVGSCFTEHIGTHLKELGYTCLSNPFGVLFNPISIAENLIHAVSATSVDEDDLVFHNELWHHWRFHGQFSNTSKDELINQCTKVMHMVREDIKEASVLIITLGSAWVYEWNTKNKMVGNCHKVPQKEFKKRLLEVEETKLRLTEMIAVLQAFNPKLQVIFTVSPVKHIRDGIQENVLSKSVLLLAVNALVNAKKVDYFPAYELITEDLRDYRFYTPDMAHPTDQAVEYVWEKFAGSVFDLPQAQLNDRISKLVQMKKHRFLFPESIESIKFQEKLMEEIQLLEAETGLSI